MPARLFVVLSCEWTHLGRSDRPTRAVVFVDSNRGTFETDRGPGHSPLRVFRSRPGSTVTKVDGWGYHLTIGPWGIFIDLWDPRIYTQTRSLCVGSSTLPTKVPLKSMRDPTLVYKRKQKGTIIKIDGDGYCKNNIVL